MIDYRCTRFVLPVSDIVAKKSNLLLNKLLIGRFRNHYNLLHDKEEARKIFDTTYNYRCAYCGVSFSALDYPLFEIDHFNPNEPKDNSLSNLVLSCHKCNRSKSDFYHADLYELCHPDYEKIINLFFRDDDFSIQLSTDYKTNQLVNNFYKQLELGSELRKLDFLLTYIYDALRSESFENEEKNKLDFVKEKLREKRNSHYRK